jgi:ferritin-like metal-binding protein YciE
MAKGAKDATAKALFKEHLEETKGQVLRLREVFQILGKKPTGKHCSGMEGLIEEGQEGLEEDLPPASKDVTLGGAALRIEHYEIAGYNAVIAMAKILRLADVVELLNENLAEEIAAAKKVTAASKPLMQQAVNEEEEDKDSVPVSKKPAKEKTSDRKSKQDEKKAAPAVKKTASKGGFFSKLLGGESSEDETNDAEE